MTVTYPQKKTYWKMDGGNFARTWVKMKWKFLWGWVEME